MKDERSFRDDVDCETQVTDPLIFDVDVNPAAPRLKTNLLYAEADAPFFNPDGKIQFQYCSTC